MVFNINFILFKLIRCPSGYDSFSTLDPEKRCDDQFIVEINQSEKSSKNSREKDNMSSLSLHILKSDKRYSGYCLYVNSDLTYSARVCRKTASGSSKFV